MSMFLYHKKTYRCFQRVLQHLHLSSVNQRLGRPSGKLVEKLLGLSYVEFVEQCFASV